MSLPTYMTRSIRTIEDAHAFVRGLDADGLFFHLEDDPTDVVTGPLGESRPTFTEDECVAILQRQEEIWTLTDDPCQLAADALGDTIDDDDEHDDDDDRCRPPFAYKPE